MNRKIMHLLLVLSILAISLAACSTEPTATVDTQTLVSTPTTGPEATVSISESAAIVTDARSEVPSTETSTEAEPVAAGVSYPIVDTGQATCYDDSGVITCPTEGEAFYGQDAQFTGYTPSYTDNRDGTVTDNVTGLVWQQSADTDGDGEIDAADKMSYKAAGTYCENLSYAGYDDWQLPTIKQLYSLIDFSGFDPSGYEGTDTSGLVPFIDAEIFDFAYGDTDANERIIDSQYASSNLYVGDGDIPLLFGVNFADGRIKGYGITLFGRDKTFSVACVQENSSYGVNDFVENGDGTITDSATGLMWAQDDSGSDTPDGLNWEEALAYVEMQNDALYLGYSDWRLPSVKELQSIVDYSRSPDTTNSAAIDPLFHSTPITNEEGETDYDFYWSSTTHANWTDNPGSAGAYVSFGRAMGYMDGTWSDVHGAGAQRSDPKSGDPSDWPTGNGPQGDAIRIYNTVRLVRSGDVIEAPDGDPSAGSAETVVALAESDSSAQPADQAGLGGQSPDSVDQPAGPGGQPPDADSQPAGPGGQLGGPGGQQPPDLAAAAAQLGVTEGALQAALGDPGQGPPDFAAAAQALGITESDLMAALGAAEGLPPADQPPADQPPADQPPADRQGPPGGQQGPDLAAAAAQLGVTEEALEAALGDPGQGLPDFAAAAQALGITESDLMAALGGPAGGPPPGDQPPADSP